MADEKKLQQKYMEYQMIEKQKEKAIEHLQQFDSKLEEIEKLKQNILNIKSTKDGEDILIPMSNGIFVKANMKKVEKLYVNIGSGVTVDKTPDETIELLDNQKNEIESYKSQLLETLQQVMIKSEELETELKLMIEGEK